MKRGVCAARKRSEKGDSAGVKRRSQRPLPSREAGERMGKEEKEGSQQRAEKVFWD